MAKKKSLTIEQRAERYRKAQHELAKIKTEMDAEISNISTEYEAQMKPLIDESFEDQTAIMKHVKAKRKQLFLGDAKSTTWQGLGLQYKKGGKSVKLREGFTEEDVIIHLRESDEYAGLVSTKTTIDKAAIKKAGLEEEELEEMGLEIVQSETLHIKV